MSREPDVLFVIEYNKLTEYRTGHHRNVVIEIPNDMLRDDYLRLLVDRVHRNIPRKVDAITFSNLTTWFRIEWDKSAGRTAMEFKVDAVSWNGWTEDQRVSFLRELPIV